MPKSKSFSPKVYWNEKNQRIQAQKQAMELILSLPSEQWGETLFDRWPEKLPKVVRSALPGQALQDWRACRAIVAEERVDEFISTHMEMMGLMERMDEALSAHDEKARELLGILLSVVGMKSITIHSEELDFEFTEENGWNAEEILEGLCWALEESGGITARQALSLRAQVRQPDGTMAWVAQERVYGFFCIDGHWEPVTPAQMRHAYTHTPDGRPLPPDPGTSFGDARDLVRESGIRNKRSH